MDEAHPVLSEHKIAVRQNEIVSALRQRLVQRREIVGRREIKPITPSVCGANAVFAKRTAAAIFSSVKDFTSFSFRPVYYTVR